MISPLRMMVRKNAGIKKAPAIAEAMNETERRFDVKLGIAHASA